MNYKELLEYVANDVEATINIKRKLELDESCKKLYELFTSLRNAGFESDDAFLMIGLLLNTQNNKNK